MLGLAAKARSAGATIAEGVEVTGFELDGSGAVARVLTSAGAIAVDQVVVAVGPWIGTVWDLLGLPARLDVRQPDGRVVADQPMWTYWYLQEGEVAVDPATFVTADGRSSPVLHVDSDQPLRDDAGRMITTEPWGVYFKPDRTTVQGGRPSRCGSATASRSTPIQPAPSRRASRHVVCSAVALSRRFEGSRDLYHRDARSPGAGAFTVDNFPVLDYMRPNVYVIADSNHGYKMIALGREVAPGARRRSTRLCSPRSVTGGSRAASCIRCRTAPIPGADERPRSVSRLGAPWSRPVPARARRRRRAAAGAAPCGSPRAGGSRDPAGRGSR